MRGIDPEGIAGSPAASLGLGGGPSFSGREAGWEQQRNPEKAEKEPRLGSQSGVPVWVPFLPPLWASVLRSISALPPAGQSRQRGACGRDAQPCPQRLRDPGASRDTVCRDSTTAVDGNGQAPAQTLPQKVALQKEARLRFLSGHLSFRSSACLPPVSLSPSKGPAFLCLRASLCGYRV